MLNIKKEIGIGFLVGLIANLAGMYIYVAIFTDYDLFNAIQLAYNDYFLGGLIAIGAIANFLPFFVYLKREEIYRARGVLILSFVMALVILWLKANEIYNL
jgi:hypothetical protein